MEKPNYYAVIPAQIRYDSSLKDKAKLLYAEITALTQRDGMCWASNNYFAELYEVSVQTISTLLKELEEKQYITRTIVYKEGTKEILHRYIKIVGEGYTNFLGGGIQENFKENNTSINNTSINKKEIYKEKRTFASIINDYTPNEELQEALNDYVEMRAKDKKFTLRALELNLNALLKMSDSPREQIEIINQSISNSWKAFYPLRVQEERRARPAEVLEDYTASNNPKIDDETKQRIRERLRERRNGNQ